jgi:heme exporter protein A
MEAGTSILVDGLRREYGERVALRDVSLRVARGESLAVIGPNGSGKTTLLRILATLLRPGGGEVAVLGAALPREAWRARGRIGYVGHEPLLYRDLTVEENLRFHARLHGAGADGERRGAELLERVGMAAVAPERAGNLSAGMAQRVAVCRALLHDPELLLLDEPLAHLDPEGARLVEPLIGGAPGRTRVVVTHDPERGRLGAERVLALRHDGSAAFSGPASELSADLLRAVYGGSA